MHTIRFPGESAEYRHARDDLLQAEIDLRRQITRVAAMRQELPLGGIVETDYEFSEIDPTTGGPRRVALSELFGDNDTLFVYSFMVVPEEQGLPFVGPCPSCTSIIDGIDGAVPHIRPRLSFVVSAGGASIEPFRAHGDSRGWRNVRLLSAQGSTYGRDYGAEDADGFQWPLATVFVRRADRIHHFWSSELWFVPHDEGQGPRHVDFMWPLWAVFDRVPDGRGPDWESKLSYD